MLDGIPVDLPDVEVRLHLLDARAGDPVGGAVDPLGGRGGRFAQRFPEGALDESDDAAGGLGGAAVVFAAAGAGWCWSGRVFCGGGVAYLACQKRRT